VKILVTGANGLLGQHLVKKLLAQAHTVIATGRGVARLPFNHSSHYRYYEADLLDEVAVYGLFINEKPDVVVHAAAMTQLDECEQHRGLCEQINVKATAMIALYAEEFSKHLVYISSDFVFDGEKGHYTEEDACNPVSWYGFTKVQAESIVESSSVNWTIVRTCLVYGNVLSGTRTNIVSWVKENLEKGHSIKVVCDQWRTPTYVADLAHGIALVIQQQATGVYHISGKEFFTPYDMAVKTARYFKLNEALIEKTDASVFTQPAKRPPKTGFSILKAQQQLGYEPVSFEDGLRKMDTRPIIR
jgi:dTDP-4-dehydrorhamnose reductase